MPKRIVISGYYGFGNTGDEAVLAGIIAGFRESGLDEHVTVLSADPARTKADHPGIHATYRWCPIRVARAILRADVLVSGGGSLIQDATGAVSPYYYLSVLRFAQMLRRKTVVYAQGLGPLERGCTRRATAKAFGRADIVTVRDSDSKALLESIGVTRPVEVVADPAFLVAPDLRAADALLAEKGLLGREFIVVCLRRWPGPAGWESVLSEGIYQAASEVGVGVAVIPMQEPDDLGCADIPDAVFFRNLGGPGVVKGLISRCGLVVGMRLHSLIFAAAEAAPFLPIVYDPKVDSFARAAGVRDGLDVRSVNSGSVKESIVRAWREREETRAILAGKTGQWRASAAVPVRLLTELLQEQPQV